MLYILFRCLSSRHQVRNAAESASVAQPLLPTLKALTHRLDKLQRVSDESYPPRCHQATDTAAATHRSPWNLLSSAERTSSFNLVTGKVAEDASSAVPNHICQVAAGKRPLSIWLNAFGQLVRRTFRISAICTGVKLRCRLLF